MIEEGHDIEDYLANTEMEALHIASFLGNFEIIRFIVQKVEFINSTDSYGNTPIDYAKDERIKSLLEKNGGESSSEMWNSIYHDFNAANEIKFGTLQGKKLLQAARSGNINSLKNILSLSLQEGGPLLLRLSACDSEGNSALHLAANSGQKDAVILLLEHGLGRDMTNNKGETAKAIAIKAGYNEIALKIENFKKLA